MVKQAIALYELAIQGKENHNKMRDEDTSFHLIGQPLRTCYLEFSKNHGLNLYMEIHNYTSSILSKPAKKARPAS